MIMDMYFGECSDIRQDNPMNRMKYAGCCIGLSIESSSRAIVERKETAEG